MYFPIASTVAHLFQSTIPALCVFTLGLQERVYRIELGNVVALNQCHVEIWLKSRVDNAIGPDHLLLDDFRKGVCQFCLEPRNFCDFSTCHVKIKVEARGS